MITLEIGTALESYTLTNKSMGPPSFTRGCFHSFLFLELIFEVTKFHGRPKGKDPKHSLLQYFAHYVFEEEVVQICKILLQ